MLRSHWDTVRRDIVIYYGKIASSFLPLLLLNPVGISPLHPFSSLYFYLSIGSSFLSTSIHSPPCILYTRSRNRRRSVIRPYPIGYPSLPSPVPQYKCNKWKNVKSNESEPWIRNDKVEYWLKEASLDIPLLNLCCKIPKPPPDLPAHGMGDAHRIFGSKERSFRLHHQQPVRVTNKPNRKRFFSVPLELSHWQVSTYL